MYDASYEVDENSAGVDQRVEVKIAFSRGPGSSLKFEGLLLDVGERPPADPAAGRSSVSKLVPPFAGSWYVMQGGEAARGNHHVLFPEQRHALDLVVWKDGSTHRGDGKKNEDYWAWKQEVLAPVAGTVIARSDGAPDQPPVPEAGDPTAPAGNHVVIDTGRGEFVLLAHLVNGSVRVKKGAKVAAGDVVGLCGSSGNSTTPHIHVHVQNRPELFDERAPAVSVPMRFVHYLEDGTRTAAARIGHPFAGQFFSTLPASSIVGK